MRVGQNPSKEQPITPSDKIHQVIIPVYIPHQNEYYAQSFEVFKLCITSLLKTCHAHTAITVVNNGSCEAVQSYLDGLLKNKQIDELVHTGNIGKLNAILKGVCGHRFLWVTIADADTLFLNDWQKATYKVFETFPKAGVVGLTPQFRMYKSHSNHVLFDNFFSKNLRFQQVNEPEAMQRFYKSIGWDDSYNKDYLKQALALQTPKGSALVGTGHYVATYKAAMFQSIPTFLNAKLGRNTEQYLDELPLQFGLWRLTTTNNYACHMGNTPAEWMLPELKKLRPDSYEPVQELNYSLPSKTGQPVYFIKHKLFSKLLKWPVFYRRFLSYKGLPKEMIKKY